MRRLGRPSGKKEGAFSASGATHLLFFCVTGLTGIETPTGIEYSQPIPTISFTQTI